MDHLERRTIIFTLLIGEFWYYFIVSLQEIVQVVFNFAFQHLLAAV